MDKISLVQPRILILGGYGNFGKRLSEVLASRSSWHIMIGGRKVATAQRLVNEIKAILPDAQIEPYLIDWQQEDFVEKLQNAKADIVIHSAGPFQTQDYTVARTCIALKIHYLDLSDAREFVTNIEQLDEKAKENDVIVISGASSVPGLSSAVVANFASKFGLLREIDFGIAPGNKADRGHATIAAVLAGAGKPFLRLQGGEWKTVYGWQDSERHYYGDNLGLRWQANLDIPDLELFPRKYPTLQSVVFHAGLEVPFLHFMMGYMSWVTRLKIIPNWAPLSRLIMAISNLFNRWGTDKGGMYVRLRGSNLEYQPLEITWNLVAEQGHGPYIPIIGCLILIEKIVAGQITSGAKSCMGLFTIEEFNRICGHWHIYSTIEEKEM